MAKIHHITCLLFFVIFLLIESCKDCGCHNCGYDYPCYATNTIILFKDGVAIDTFNFYDIQSTMFMNKCVPVEEARLRKGPRGFSKDDVLDYNVIQNIEVIGILTNSRPDEIFIVEQSDYDYNIRGTRGAPTQFITVEGYKLLEYCDYDSVTMEYTFDQFMYESQEDIERLIAKGYELY